MHRRLECKPIQNIGGRGGGSPNSQIMGAPVQYLLLGEKPKLEIIEEYLKKELKDKDDLKFNLKLKTT